LCPLPGEDDVATGIRVECYAGYRADQRPLRFALGVKTLQVMEVADQWYSPANIYFKVLAEDGNVYVLRHDESHDTWTLEAFRSGK
jgi:hypothetical protein